MRRERENVCLHTAIASEAKQSRVACAALDCFVALLPAMTVWSSQYAPYAG
jgi:hypothetical protein